MPKLSTKPYSLRDHDKRHTAPVMIPRPAEPRTRFVEDEQPKKHYRGTVRATLSNTCEVCGELVQEPGDLYCSGDKCPDERGNGFFLDDLRGEDDE